MDINTFIKTATKSGYANKKQAQKWCKKNPKDEYTEDDYVELFRFAQQNSIGEDIPLSKWRIGYGCRTTKHFKVEGYK